MHRGFIKLHRKTLDWEWKNKPLTLALFVHLLLNANHKENKWQGISIKAGQLISGRKQLSIDTGLTERQIRTALNHLKSTNEVTIKTTNKYSIITITNWDLYQSNDQQNAIKRPTNDQQPTTLKECKNEKNVKNNKTALRPDYISEDVWNDFLLLRKRKKAPLTETALNRISNEADKANYTLEDALKECCLRGWVGFKADWVNKTTFENNAIKGDANAELQKFLEQH